MWAYTKPPTHDPTPSGMRDSTSIAAQDLTHASKTVVATQSAANHWCPGKHAACSQVLHMVDFANRTSSAAHELKRRSAFLLATPSSGPVAFAYDSAPQRQKWPSSHCFSCFQGGEAASGATFCTRRFLLLFSNFTFVCMACSNNGALRYLLFSWNGGISPEFDKFRVWSIAGKRRTRGGWQQRSTLRVPLRLFSHIGLRLWYRTYIYTTRVK